MPHSPQLFLSVLKLTHMPSQRDSPKPQLHIPPLHVPPKPQELLQLPQCEVLVSVSTHMPSHSVSPPAHPATQVPPLHA